VGNACKGEKGHGALGCGPERWEETKKGGTHGKKEGAQLHADPSAKERKKKRRNGHRVFRGDRKGGLFLDARVRSQRGFGEGEGMGARLCSAEALLIFSFMTKGKIEKTHTGRRVNPPSGGGKKKRGFFSDPGEIDVNRVGTEKNAEGACLRREKPKGLTGNRGRKERGGRSSPRIREKERKRACFLYATSARGVGVL